MSKKINRQSLRTRKMLRNALVELLKEKPLDKISISEITDRADLARSTFYTHFDTKEDLLHCCIDEPLSAFIDELKKKEGFGKDKDVDIQSLVRFFRLWSEKTELIELLSVANLDKIVINRLRKHYLDMYNQKVSIEFPALNPVLAEYYHDFMSYGNFGLLRFWIESGMRHSPETMGRLMYELTGPQVSKRIVDVFKEEIS